MNLQHIAPIWARWLIIPAVTGFAALGIFLVSLFLRAQAQEGAWILLVLGIPVAIFPFYVAYRGIDLVKFRNIRAALVDDQLIVQQGASSEPISYRLSSLQIIDHPRMQLTNVVELGTRTKVFTADHYYTHAMDLLRLLKQRQGEQVAAPNGP